SSHRESLGIDDARAAQSHHAFGREERRLHQYLRRLTGSIVLPVGNQRRFLLLDITLGRSLSACHPQRQRALVPPLLVVHNRRGYTISPALLWLEPALNRVGPRLHRTLLRVFLFLCPLAFLEAPVQQHFS